jgi:hypothetical protein
VLPISVFFSNTALFCDDYLFDSQWNQKAALILHSGSLPNNDCLYAPDIVISVVDNAKHGQFEQ